MKKKNQNLFVQQDLKSAPQPKGTQQLQCLLFLWLDLICLFVCLFVCLFSEGIQDQAKFKEIGISSGSVDQLARVRLSFSFLDARLH